MANKNAANLRRLHGNVWLAQQDQGPAIELNQNVEMGPFPEALEETGGLPVLDGHNLHPPALREMLESDNYQLALIPRGAWDHIRESPMPTPSALTTAVLLRFSWKELVARVCESVRDSNNLTELTVVRFGDVCVDFTTMEVSRSSGEAITLTTQQFKVLKCFLFNPNRVFSRAELLKEAWGYENYPSTRIVDNQVMRLRQKLERDPPRPVHFRTVHRVGYKFVP